MRFWLVEGEQNGKTEIERVAQKRHNEKNGINKEGMNKEGMVENGVGAGWLERRVHEKKQ